MTVFRKDPIRLEEVKSKPGLRPLKDEVLLYLWEQALQGKLMVHSAAVPFELVIPFDKEYDPRKNSVGRAAVDEVMENWVNGTFQHVWLYPKQDRFVLSDDYIVYYAAVEGEPTYLPAFILGDFNHSGVKDVQGPFKKEDVRRILFGETGSSDI